ncbi:HET-domain-containing protein [Xylariaceae sp. AK1471]|nr:HET-domain-containing protein [Xylariaceae sp. AK1471]
MLSFFESFWSQSTMARRPNKKPLRDFQGIIVSALTSSGFDGRFLPQSALSSLIGNADLGVLLPRASEDLIKFVRRDAPRVFLTIALSLDVSGDELVEVVKSFQERRFTDKALPVENIELHMRCLDRESDVRCKCPECTLLCEKGGVSCAHDKVLNVFHNEDWGSSTFGNFYNNQWIFSAPVFKKSNFRQFNTELPEKTILPFTWKSTKPHSGHFSNVFEAKLHADHQDEFDSNGREEVHVALKELKNALGEEADYEVEKAWRLEATTLDELSELNDNHLIRRIAAFKHRAMHYIMFEWADGGTLRDFWARNRQVHLDLNHDRIKELLEQLCGLTGALCELHKTNTRTTTALAEVDMKSPSLSNTSLRMSSSNTNVGWSNKPRNSPSKALSGNNGIARSTANVVPTIVLPGEDGDIIAKHWRHGDLKPENILVFQDSTWLGTLKIADLGLAKQHDFATEFRPGATSTNHTTLHYEAPEVVTNTKEPRSRRYDIWSMGCIILESVIWLLYGFQGLESFYNERMHFANYTPQTLYFTTKSYMNGEGRNELVASVSDIATHWISEMLKNDPECKKTTVISELLELVRDRLLVVAVPRKSRVQGPPHRCTAGELKDKLDIIRIAAEDDNEYLFTGKNRKHVKPPRPLGGINKNMPPPKTTGSGDLLGVNHSLPHRSPQHALLDNTWDVSEDSLISLQLLKTEGLSIPNVLSEDISALCKRCLELDFRDLGLIAREELSALKERAKSCAFCELLHYKLETSGALGANNAGMVVEIWRVRNGLALNNRGTPMLSICKTPSVHTDLDETPQYIPIGLPKLATIASPTYFELLRQWLQDCDSNHAGCDEEAKETLQMIVPTRLIDVGKKGSPNVHLLETYYGWISQVQHFRYIAVSHPWGDKVEHNHYCTTRLNIDHHKAGIPIDVLPDTFKDAILVTREFGVQYLWIDSLCIVQGEGGDFDEEAKHMETVFSSAYCVIAATRAKGMSSGFIKSRPERKVVKFERPGKTSFYVCETIDNFQRDVIEGSLNKRGWVLQERALARRTIYFAENQTYWECGFGVRCETLTRMKNNQAALLGDPKFPKVATDSPKGGQIRLYELLYKQYSRLQFTKAYDRPLAIAGLEQRLIRAFDTQGGYGVFTRYFGRSLLWQRDTTASQAMKPIQFPKTQQYQVPSWSWMAYEGAITFMDLPFGEVDWEEKEMRSPWSPLSPVLSYSAISSSSYQDIASNASWHTANTNGRIDLTAKARDFLAAADTFIVYDRGERPNGRVVKCVIVGRKKLSADFDGRQLHYVLVVAQKSDGGHHARYERIGVGALPASSITLEGPGTAVQVF